MTIHFLSSKSLLITSCCLIVVTACTNLEQEVFSELTPDNFLQTEEELVAAIGPAYTSLYPYMGTTSLWAAQEISSDELVVPTRGADWDDGGHWVRLHQHAWTPDDPTINNTWDFLYNGVFTCNRLLFELEELDRPITIPFSREIRVLRAIYYLWLLDVYGNVPIITSHIIDDFFPRTVPREKVYEFVESELLRNLPSVTKKVDGTTYSKVNQMVVHAALANLYLNAQVYKDSSEWPKAIAACDVIIDSGNYQMERDYFANFDVDNASSSEFIFAIPYDATYASGLQIAVHTLSPLHQQTYDLAISPLNGWCTLKEFYDSYEDGDIRKGMPSTEEGPFMGRGNFLVGPQWDLSGVVRLMDTNAVNTSIDPDGPPFTLRSEINELFPSAWNEAGARIGKYEIEIGGTFDMNNDFPIYRYTDILLIKAEALWRKNPNDIEALELVNQVRARAGVIPFTELTAENLLAERGREFFAESKRRTDLIRFGKFTDAWWEKNLQESCKTLFPIPQNQLDANPNLFQNPCY